MDEHHYRLTEMRLELAVLNALGQMTLQAPQSEGQ